MLAEPTARGSMRVSELADEADFLPTDRRTDLNSESA
jgi:hypothetical protein